MKDLSIIIVNWNTQKLLIGCLNSIFNQTKDLDYEVIVVDNGSTDSSVRSVNELKNSRVKVIKNKQNLGFSKANNQGIKVAKGEWILLLNSDTVLEDNPLSKMVAFARTKPNLAVLGPRLLFADGRPQPSTAHFFTLIWALIWLLTGDRFVYASPDKAIPVDWVMGSAFLVKRSSLGKIGLLDENFFMYLEEVEWCYRIKKAGFEVWFSPEAEIVHLVRGSSLQGRKLAVEHIHKNLIYFYQKHFAPWQLAVLKLILWLKTNLKQPYEKAFKSS